MLTFGIYETIRSRIPADIPNWLGIMVAAALGDAVGSLWLTPSEVIKSKTQTGLYSSPINAVRAIATQPGNGGPLAFYQGYSAALARDVPFRVVQMILFEQCRALYVRHIRSNENNQQQQRDALSPLENLLIGAVSGSITAFVTNPLDVIRTRVMSQPIGEQALYRNALDCVVKTLSKEGVGALFKGAGPRTFMVGPASAIFFLTYEGFKTFFRNRSNRVMKVAWSPGTRNCDFNHKGFCCPRRRTIT